MRAWRWLACASSLVLAACGDDSPETALRVVHLSADAPRIDVFVDGEGPLVSGLAFGGGSDAVHVTPGDRDIQIAPAGDGADGAVVTVSDARIEDGGRYTAVAFGALARVQASVVEDDASGLASGDARVRVIHAAEGVGTVDLYVVPDAGAPEPLAENLRYGGASDPVDITAGALVVGIDLDDDAMPDRLFALDALPAGEVVNVFTAVDAEGTPFLLVQGLEETVRVDALRQRLRVVHLGPDVPSITPLVGDEALTSIAFGASTDYADLAGGETTLDLTTDGTSAMSLLGVPLQLEQGRTYTAVALGRAASLDAVVFEDDTAGLSPIDVRVRAIHAAPDLGPIDVYAVAADGDTESLLSDVDFGDAAEPFDLPYGAYTLGIDRDDDATPDLYFTLPELDGGALANLYLAQDAEGDAFVLAQLEGATTSRVDPSQSDVRVLHLSRDAPSIDVYAGSATAAVTNLAFKAQSSVISVPSGALSVAVTATGSDTRLLDTSVRVLPERAYTVVVYDDLASIDVVALEDDAAGLSSSSIRVPITHVAPGVTRGDVYELLGGGTTFGTQLVDDFGFGETEAPVDLPAGTYTIGFDAEADGDVQAIFDLPLLTPGTYARAYVFQEASGSVGVLVQLRSSVVVVPAR
ncbi:DUF4397 domain-containing protein [Sandaracinus amylolyticus]|uniref:DUF4397 domain-containing protein n=1 Tax=Sandaracinus amylolyticus TaxID=927083 RepID=UPI001F35C343|nr:DUF4397 domain-containing protein [Sandaracinus amylolyticus]UJR86980.1 Hypothetical protein I5071_90810 [Sandaracinus amylolyticus]